MHADEGLGKRQEGCTARDEPRFNPWIRKIPRRREWPERWATRKTCPAERGAEKRLNPENHHPAEQEGHQSTAGRGPPGDPVADTALPLQGARLPVVGWAAPEGIVSQMG